MEAEMSAIPVALSFMDWAVPASLARNGTSGTSWCCHDPAGWGPFVPDGLDLTRCFYYGVVLNIPNIFALVGATYQIAALKGSKLSIRIGSRIISALVLIAVQALLWVLLAWKNVARGVDVSVFTPVLSALLLVPVAILTYRERLYSAIPSASLLFYWLFSTISLVSICLKTDDALEISLAVLSLVLFVNELWPRKRSVYEEFVDAKHNNPYDEANVFSRLTFSWMTALMRKGYETYLTASDLPELAADDRTAECTKEFDESWDKQIKSGKPSLFKALAEAFGARYCLGGFFKLVQDSLSFVQPQLLRYLIAFVQEYRTSKGEIPLTKGLYIAVGMFVVSVLQTMALHQYFERAFGTGMRVRSALTNSIFSKSLVLSNEERATKTIGDTVNLMAIDTQRLQDFCPNGNIIWSGPFQILLCLISLYNLVGHAMWAGVVVMIVLIPLNSMLARKQKVLQQDQMQAKDLRTRLTNEILSSIKSIKLYAWEKPFVGQLEHARNVKELGSLRKLGIFNSSTTFLWNFAPFLVSCSTFALYIVINDTPLTTDMVFPALALFNLLAFPMAVFPMLISGLIEARVALQRVTSFLLAEQLQSNAVEHLPRCTEVGETAVSVDNASFVWQREPVKPALTDLNLSAEKGSLTCLVGRVGSGKSAVLQALLGDIYKISGTVKVHGSVAYVAQNPWIFNGSVKENILFGCRYDESIYNETIRACALLSDLDVLPDGDSTIVGEKGISLSGGQKARISLARAVYSRADVYLLDDPLSAVDEHVGRHIIDNVLGKNGVIASKCIILATNSIPVLRNADQILMLVKGNIVEQGHYAQVSKGSGKIAALLAEFGREDTSDDSQAKTDKSSQKDSGSSTEVPSSSSATSLVSAGSVEHPKPFTVDEQEQRVFKRRGSARRPSVASWKVEPPLELRKEHMEQGKVSWNIYAEYARVSGLKLVAVFFVVLLISSGLSVAANVWLKHWSEVNTGADGNPRIAFYLSVYAVLGIGAALFSVVQNLVLWLGLAMRSARTLHDRMLKAVVRAPMWFFETTPLGRIINRFSNDVYRVDQQLARTFFMLFSNSVRVLYTFAVIAFGTPEFLILILPLAWFYFYYQRFYLRTSRELKRLESVSKSPIFAQFQETLDGISTVRAYGQAPRFNFVNQNYIDANNRAYFPSISANRWLAVRLEFAGSVIIFAAAGLAVLSLSSGRISAGLIGLALSYALSITQSLNWIVRMTVEVETNIVSVERMLEYADLPSEAPEIIPGHRPPQGWPSHGAISLDNYSTRYRPELPLVLKDINLDIKPGEKIGIVGRTGAGKSSLTLALFRLIEPAGGHIDIDKLDTSSIGLYDLRSHMSIIPQDAQVFEGTVRSNLDPMHLHDDAALWRVLDLSHLREFVDELDGGLDAKITEGGSNMSNGQRQLVCLARAMLTKTRVLVLDEATAAVDVETDKIIQDTIRKEFKDRTILTIAHRLNTIMDSDRVVTLSYGKISEVGTPQELLANKDSLFYSLAKQGGLVK